MHRHVASATRTCLDIIHDANARRECILFLVILPRQSVSQRLRRDVETSFRRNNAPSSSSNSNITAISYHSDFKHRHSQFNEETHNSPESVQRQKERKKLADAFAKFASKQRARVVPTVEIKNHRMHIISERITMKSAETNELRYSRTFTFRRGKSPYENARSRNGRSRNVKSRRQEQLARVGISLFQIGSFFSISLGARRVHVCVCSAFSLSRGYLALSL